MYRKVVTIICLMYIFCVQSQAINVFVNADKDVNPNVVAKIEQRLSSLLTEINNAQEEDRPLQLAGLGMNETATSTIQKLWVVAQFYCPDEDVTDRLWTFRKCHMVRSIPLIIVPDDADKWAEGTYQEAVVEFDLSGNIIDFRFSFSSHLGESMERSMGTAVDAERKMQILAWCDRLATAYNEHNMEFMRKVFSDNALIITGKVITERNSELGITNQKVIYNKQNKMQYLTNLAKTFARNKWIKVEFDEVGIGGLEGGCGPVTRSNVNPNFYGVRLHQKWRSSSYSDEGYVFFLWNFTDESRPQIEVRTWQPEMVGGKKIDSDEIMSLANFEADLVGF